MHLKLNTAVGGICDYDLCRVVPVAFDPFIVCFVMYLPMAFITGFFDLLIRVDQNDQPLIIFCRGDIIFDHIGSHGCGNFIVVSAISPEGPAFVFNIRTDRDRFVIIDNPVFDQNSVRIYTEVILTVVIFVIIINRNCAMAFVTA